MNPPEFDAIIIGGGPGGSTAATYLSQAGRRVLVLEKEHFPRFHIGESLLPYNRSLFEEMGVLEELVAAGFPVKHGAQFHLGNSSACLKLKFRNGGFTRHTTAFQVERAKFDHILLKHARRSGAEVREGWTVAKFESDADRVTVQARNNQGEAGAFSASYLLDCSGRANLTGNQERQRVTHPQLRKVAIFGHFEGVELDESDAAGDTVIVRLGNKWFWIIPTALNRISVGLVMDQQEFADSGESPAKMFHRVVESSPEMQKRMSQAKLQSSVQATTDFSYYNKRLIGDRLLRVGDAAGFMDPIFSAGVYLAMYSGRLAARTVSDCLTGRVDVSRRLTAYEKRVFRALKYYWELSLGFYTNPFMELFMQPRKVAMVPDAVVAILAGELDGGWKLWWRRKLFFFLVWFHGHRALVPRLTIN